VTAPERLCALPGLTISAVRQPAAHPASMSASVSPAIQDRPKSSSSSRATSSSIPGAGLRHAQGPDNPGTTPSGWCRHIRQPSSSTPAAASTSTARACTSSSRATVSRAFAAAG
jgi:hypothetical protein